MPENDRLDSCSNEIELGLMERETTPKLLMKLGIQPYLVVLSLSNTVSILEIFGVSRAQPTIHNWVHEPDLQPEIGRSLDYVAVDETAIQFNNDQYQLYAAVNLETNKVPHTMLEPTTDKVIAHAFLAELREKHNVSDAALPTDGSHSLKHARRRHSLDFRYACHGNQNSVKRVF